MTTRAAGSPTSTPGDGAPPGPASGPASAAAGRPTRVSPFWAAWVATLLFFAGFYSLLVPLPLYLAEIGLPDWQIGLILGAFGVASLLWRALAGVGVDHWGSRPVLLLGSAALIVGATAVPWTESALLLGLLRLIQAAGYVAFTTAGTALVIALTPETERGGRMAVFGAAANVAITLAPAAGTALLAVAPLTTGFWLAGGLALVAGLLASTVASPDRPAGLSRSWRAAWSVPRVLWLPMLMTSLFGMGFAAFFLFAPILSERRDVSAGLLYTVYGIGIILTRFTGGRWIDRAGTLRTVALASGILGGGLVLAAVATSPLWLGLASFLVAAGGGLFHPALIAHHSRLLPDAPGRASAGFYLGFDLGIGLGSWVLGVVLEYAGIGWLYGVAALLIVLTVPLLPILREPARPLSAPGSGKPLPHDA